MSEERLKAIEKEINYRLKKERIITVDFSVLCELYNEVIRLKEENKYLDELRNANYLSWQDSLSRIEKAVEYIKELISATKGTLNDMNYCDKKETITQYVESLEYDINHYEYLLNILNGRSDE